MHYAINVCPDLDSQIERLRKEKSEMFSEEEAEQLYAQGLADGACYIGDAIAEAFTGEKTETTFDPKSKVAQFKQERGK